MRTDTDNEELVKSGYVSGNRQVTTGLRRRKRKQKRKYVFIIVLALLCCQHACGAALSTMSEVSEQS